jgi:hypothetical protein
MDASKHSGNGASELQKNFTLSTVMAQHMRTPRQQKNYKTMRTLLRHIPSGKYFQSLDKWTIKAQKAHDFKLGSRALKFVAATGFRDMELVLRLETPPRTT